MVNQWLFLANQWVCFFFLSSDRVKSVVSQGLLFCGSVIVACYWSFLVSPSSAGESVVVSDESVAASGEPVIQVNRLSVFFLSGESVVVSDESVVVFGESVIPVNRLSVLSFFLETQWLCLAS